MRKKQGSFRETLQEGWLTTEILTETLAKFTGELSESQLKSMGYSADQVTEIIKLGQMANDAATKVKTLTQLFDTLKEAVQSGWSQSWRTIIGDFEEAKALFTALSNGIGAIIQESSDARNEVLSGGITSGWEQLMKQGIMDEEGYKEALGKTAKAHGINIEQMITDRKKLADIEGKTLNDAQAFKSIIKSGTIPVAAFSEAINELTNKTKGLSEAELKKLGYTKAQIESLEELNKGIQEGSISMEEFHKKMARDSGRETMLQALSNVLMGLATILKPIEEAFAEIFPKVTGEQLYIWIQNFKELTEKFKIGDETAAKLKSTFRGLFSIISIGGQLFKAFVNGVSSLVGYFIPTSAGLLGITASLGDFLVKLNETIKKTNVFNIVFQGIANGVKFTAEIIRKAIDAIVKSFNGTAKIDIGFFSGLMWIIGQVGKAFVGLSNAIGGVFKNADFNSILSFINGDRKSVV
jgi:hypothetical protein